MPVGSNQYDNRGVIVDAYLSFYVSSHWWLQCHGRQLTRKQWKICYLWLQERCLLDRSTCVSIYIFSWLTRKQWNLLTYERQECRFWCHSIRVSSYTGVRANIFWCNANHSNCSTSNIFLFNWWAVKQPRDCCIWQRHDWTEDHYTSPHYSG